MVLSVGIRKGECPDSRCGSFPILMQLCSISFTSIKAVCYCHRIFFFREAYLQFIMEKRPGRKKFKRLDVDRGSVQSRTAANNQTIFMKRIKREERMKGW